MSPERKDEIAVRIPRSLSGRALRSAIGLGLLYIARGRTAPAVEPGPTSTYRIKLDATAQIYLPVASRICGGDREAITAALSWLQNAPAWVLANGLTSPPETSKGNSHVVLEALELESA